MSLREISNKKIETYTPSRDSQKKPTDLSPDHMTQGISKIMTTNLSTVTPEEDLLVAWKLMSELGVHHLPVVSAEGELIGILSDRDLARIGHQITSFFVKDIMTKRVIIASEETSVSEVIQVMINEKISSIPVLDASNKIKGIVTDTDILKSLC